MTGPTHRRRASKYETFGGCNHKQTYRQETGGRYLWSPKTNRNGARNQSYDNMRLAVTGDIVFSVRTG